jgi:hypothetical protein
MDEAFSGPDELRLSAAFGSLPYRKKRLTDLDGIQAEGFACSGGAVMSALLQFGALRSRRPTSGQISTHPGITWTISPFVSGHTRMSPFVSSFLGLDLSAHVRKRAN